MPGVRFAPSPTGSFHIGNLRTAWISWKLARAQNLPWVVRFEDIDQPRVVPGAQEEQLSDMRELGLVPDQVIVQSSRRARHWELFKKAVSAGKVYPCVCSRKEIQSAMEEIASAPHLAIGAAPPVYSGRCRIASPTRAPQAQSLSNALMGWRLKCDDPSGAQDFIVARASFSQDPATFVPSYHWACAIDDLDGEYDLLVRAADLSSATEIQRKIQAWICGIEGRTPRFPAVFHTSLVVQNHGHRLEKRTPGVTFKELKAQGWTAEAICQRFDESFDSAFLKREFQPSEILGEASPSLSLQDLGIN